MVIYTSTAMRDMISSCMEYDSRCRVSMPELIAIKIVISTVHSPMGLAPG